MASAIHVGSPPYHPPSFSRNSTDSSVNGILSQQQTKSFEAAQLIAPTPTATPPASRGHQHIMPLSLATYGQSNGTQYSAPGARGLGDMNGKKPQQRYALTGKQPQIYTAAYSSVSVYEMEVNGIAVMRRRNDSWLNATQILKVAGIEKGKRTKVLEKEILAGEHEKVQGGYGKYQGTWVNYKRGVDFCRQYCVEELLRPLLEYDMGQDGLTTAGQGNMDTPTKEQAMAAQRKRNMQSGGIENRPPAQSPNGTFFKNISKTAANAVSAISKARLGSPGPRPASGNRRPISSRPSSQTLVGSQESSYQSGSQLSMHSIQAGDSFSSNTPLDPALKGQNGLYYGDSNNQRPNGEAQEPPRKRARPSNQDTIILHSNGGHDVAMKDATPAELSQSFAMTQQCNSQPTDLTLSGLPPLPQPSTKQAIEKQHILTSLFLDPSQTDFSKHPVFLHLSGEDLDIPIDATAHTALHWAATLARTSLLRALIAKGASIFRVNGGGETALIRAALTTNNLDQGSFPELLELLGPTIEIRDGRGRTVLHHIAVSSAVKGRSAACRYYLESLLEFVVRQGSAPSSQQNSFNGVAGSIPPPMRSIGLARFMSEIVNAADMSGDTALNLAARIGNKSIIHQLLEVGANPAIPNGGGLRPVDFGVGGEVDATEVQPNLPLTKMERNPVSKVTESSQELMTSISNLLNDVSSSFKSELQSKQSLIDQTHSKLRETSSLLAIERRRLSSRQRKASERKFLRQKIANLRRANDESRKELETATGVAANPELRSDIKLGEADAGLEVDPSLLPALEGGESLNIAPAQRDYLDSLPPCQVLLARVTAYGKNNATLDLQAKSLQSRSSELESQLRRVVAICTGASVEKVDGMVEGLVAAIESERGEDVEVGRVREFLRKVKGKEQ